MFSDPAIDFGEEMCAAKGTTGREKQTKRKRMQRTRPGQKGKKRREVDPIKDD